MGVEVDEARAEVPDVVVGPARVLVGRDDLSVEPVLVDGDAFFLALRTQPLGAGSDRPCGEPAAVDDPDPVPSRPLFDTDQGRPSTTS